MKTRGRLPFQESLDINLALAAALDYLHEKGLAHGDIKPGNIVFVNGRPKLADIGTVAGTADQGRRQHGTPGYAAPEGPGTPAADVFSLGRVIYEIMTGLDRAKCPSLPPGFEAWANHDRFLELNGVIGRATALKVDGRFPSAKQLLEALVVVQAGRSKLEKTLKRRLWAARWALAGLAVVALGVAGKLVSESLALREHDREADLREADRRRTGVRTEGWTTNTLAKLHEAANVRLDNDVRSQAAATLAGLEIHRTLHNTNWGAYHLEWSSSGDQLLVDGGNDLPSGLLDPRTGQFREFPRLPHGGLAGEAGDVPVHFGRTGVRTFGLRDPHSGEVRREFEALASPIMAASEVVAFDYLPRAGYATVALRSTNAAAPDGVLGLQDRTEGTLLAVWRAGDGKLLAEREHRATALSVAPDGSGLAIGDALGRITVFALPEMTPVLTQKVGAAPVRCFAFQRDLRVRLAAPESRLPWSLAAGFPGGQIALLDLTDQAVRMVFSGAEYETFSLAFSPDGQTLVSGGRVLLRFWDVATGKELLDSHGMDFAEALAFSPDGNRLAAGSRRGWVSEQLAVYEIESHRGVRLLRGLSAPCCLTEFSRSGRLVTALGQNWELGVWDLTNSRLERLIEVPPGLAADNAGFAFSPDEERLLFATATDACLWEWRTGKLIKRWRYPLGLGPPVWFDAEGRMFLFQWQSASQQRIATPGTCGVRELLLDGSQRAVWTNNQDTGRYLLARVVPDGKFVAATWMSGPDLHSNGVFRIFETATGREHFALPAVSPFDPEQFLVNDTGTLAAARHVGENQFWVFEVPSAKLAWKAAADLQGFSPNENWLAWAPEGNGGLAVVPWSDHRRKLNIGIEDRRPYTWVSSTSVGRHLACGLASGAVLVCDIEECYRRMEAMRFGWR